MNKRAGTLLAWVLVSAALLLPHHAQAKDMSGRLGIGADTSLGFHTNAVPSSTDRAQLVSDPSPIKIPGLSIVYQISEIFNIQLIGSFQMTSAKAVQGTAELSYSIVRWGIAPRANIALGITDDVNLNLVAGFGLVGRTATEDTTGIDAGGIGFSAELGIRPEYFFTDYFSIHTQVGFTISLLSEGNSDFNDGGFNINFFQNADLLGNAGFTFWF